MGAEGGGRGEGEGKSHNFTPKLWQQPTKQKDDTEIANQKQPIRKRENASAPVAMGNGIPGEFTNIGC